MTDRIQTERPSSANRRIESTSDEDNPFKLPEGSTGREWAIASLVVTLAAFSLCVFQVAFFYHDGANQRAFETVEEIGTAAHKRRMLTMWARDYIAFPAFCTMPFAALLALVSFYNGKSHRRLSQNALFVSIILAFITAFLNLLQIGLP